MSVDVESMLVGREASADIEKAVDDFVLGTDEGAQESPVEKVGKIYSFTIEYEHDDGRKISGAFKNQILKTSDHISVGVLRARMTGGVPVEALDRVTAQLAEAIAHCTVSLIERPPWAKNLAAIEDPELVIRIYQEVDGHEARFRGYQQDPGEGKATSI